MRRTVRLVIALCAIAAVAAPASMAAERMWVGFHDDPSFRWVNDQSWTYSDGVAGRRDHHAPPRPVEPGCSAAPRERGQPVRSRLRLRRHRRGAANRARRRTWRSC